MGWLNQVVPDGAALDESMRWAERIAAMAPAAIRAFKELTLRAATSTPTEALALGHEQAAALIGMRDTAEGARAFAERRPPRFDDE
jgi:enoyl-CoA hydratase